AGALGRLRHWRDGAAADPPGSAIAPYRLGDGGCGADGDRLGRVDDQQDRVDDGLVWAVARIDDRVQGEVQRGRTLGCPDRPDRVQQRRGAGVVALGAVEYGVVGEQVHVGAGVTA